MSPLQTAAQNEEYTPLTPLGYNGIDARGWLILSPELPTDVAYHKEGTMEECWYILKALLASSETLSIQSLQSLLQQQCPRWRGLAKVWVSQKSLHVDYVDAVKQELLLPTAIYTSFLAPK